MNSYECDVVVVGGGLAGFVAATELERAGVSIIVVEARSEVGGRVRSRRLDGAVVDLGGQYEGRRHERLRRLVKDLGLKLVPAGSGSRALLWRIGGAERVGWPPGLSLSGVVALLRTLWALQRRARSIDPHEPWRSPQAKSLDGRSLAEWLDERELRGAARVALEYAIGGFATVSADKLSFLHLLWWISRAGGVLGALRSGSELEIEEGAQAICLGLAERLRGTVLLRTQAESVTAEVENVVVGCGNSTRLRAQRAILAVPPPALRRIEFSPPLEPEQRALAEELRFGQAVKVAAVASSVPRVRHRAALGGAPVSIAWRTGDKRLFGIAHGAGADTAGDVLVTDLADVLGVDPPGCSVYEVTDWRREQFTGGGTYAVFAPGQLVRHGPHLGRPHGPVHFAGAERSSWPNSMEGAAESGARTARAVLAGLRWRSN